VLHLSLPRPGTRCCGSLLLPYPLLLPLLLLLLLLRPVTSAAVPVFPF
jgi:hypothetical protein